MNGRRWSAEPLAGARDRHGRRGAIAVPLAWLGLFFLLPLLIVLKISLADPAIAQPPYSALVQRSATGALTLAADLDNYRFLVEDALYGKAYLSSVKIAFISACLCLVVGYPMAYAMTRMPSAWRPMLLMLVILPFWTSFLLRVYAWVGLLSNHGVVNQGLQWLGLIEQPLVMLKTAFAVYVGIVYTYLPFMVLPLYATLLRLDRTLLEAAADLGCRPLRAFFTVTVPLSVPGIAAGFALVFIPALGEFVIPDLLGGGDTLMIGHVLWTEFFVNRAWPVAAAVAVVMLVGVLAVLALQRAGTRAGAHSA